MAPTVKCGLEFSLMDFDRGVSSVTWRCRSGGVTGGDLEEIWGRGEGRRCRWMGEWLLGGDVLSGLEDGESGRFY